jgi:hypothetical protein
MIIRVRVRFVTAALEHGNPRIAGEFRFIARAAAEREDRPARVADDLLVDARVAQPEAHETSIA